MGWHSECHTHEGYLVGLVWDDRGTFAGLAGYDPDRAHTSGRMRELGAAQDGDMPGRVLLRFVKVACSCGWRSPLVRVPRGVAEWVPCAVLAAEAFDDACKALWERHVRETGRALDGGYAIRELLRGP